jgi:hypothetical protein
MNKKIIGILIVTLLIGTSLSVMGTINVFNNENQNIGNKNFFKLDWMEQEKLLASDGTAEDAFGCNVDIDGEYAIIGTWSGTGGSSGSAYIFKRENEGWVEQAKLTASDGSAGNLFGVGVDLDGSYALISAHGNVDSSAYVFKRENEGWVEQAKLTASDGDGFGYSIALDGEYAVIGAPQSEYGGAAYVFKRNDETWTEQAKLTVSGGEFGDYFGNGVALDGEFAFIGAPFDDDNGDRSGSAYVFKRSGSTWTEQAKFISPDGLEKQEFGWHISMDEGYALVSSTGNYTNQGFYVFKLEGSDWVESTKISPSEGCYFRGPVSLDEEFALIGGGNSAYVYIRENDGWVESDKLTASDGDGVGLYNGFGYSVSLYGEYALIGARYDDENGEEAGAAYVYMYTENNRPEKSSTPDGPTSGKSSETYEYSSYSTDIDNDDLYYLFDWGDETNSGWIGPYESGETAIASKSWNKSGEYQIRVKAKDEHNLESEWSDPLEVTMPKTKSVNTPFLQFLENHPKLFPLLRLLLKL